jgi:DNA-binding CsgD family transcriptional regulator
MQIDGADPKNNSSVCVGSAAPELTILENHHFTTEEDRRRFSDYAALIDRFDFPFRYLTPLVRQGPVLIGLAVNRCPKKGQITKEQRRAFAAIAPHARSGVRAQLALSSQGPAFAVGALEAVGLTGFVCDSTGRVEAMTPSAERLVVEGQALRLRGGILTASVGSESRALTNGLARVTGDDLAPAADGVVIRGAQGDLALALQFARLRQSLFAGPSAVVVVREMAPAGTASVSTAKTLLRLTQAETAVVERLMSGDRPAVIATGLGVSLTTVRSHVRNILSKASARSVVGLIARMRSL